MANSRAWALFLGVLLSPTTARAQGPPPVGGDTGSVRMGQATPPPGSVIAMVCLRSYMEWQASGFPPFFWQPHFSGEVWSGKGGCGPTDKGVPVEGGKLGLIIEGWRDGLMCGSTSWLINGQNENYVANSWSNDDTCWNDSDVHDYQTTTYGRIWNTPTGGYLQWGPLSSAAVPALTDLLSSNEPWGNRFGPVPNAAYTSSGLDEALLPDFFGVLNRQGGVAGFVPKEYLVGRAPRMHEEIAPVFNEDETLVGHMYPGRGFVPLGQDPESVPPIKVTSRKRTK
jgi:hypothetical protein